MLLDLSINARRSRYGCSLKAWKKGKRLKGSTCYFQFSWFEGRNDVIELKVFWLFAISDIFDRVTYGKRIVLLSTLKILEQDIEPRSSEPVTFLKALEYI